MIGAERLTSSHSHRGTRAFHSQTKALRKLPAQMARSVYFTCTVYAREETLTKHIGTEGHGIDLRAWGQHVLC